MSTSKPMPDHWAEHEARSLAQRRANEEASRSGEPLPYPNPWDVWDPTKLPRDAPPEAQEERYREFQKLCRPKPRIRHVL